MLGKLIKYDFKALSRYLILIHGMLLITAVLGRFLFIGRLVQEPNSGLSEFGMAIMTIGMLIYVILFMTAVFGTMLMIAIHFYKNLYSDEGYLTHTLPVSRGQLLMSKTISGSIWMLIDIALVVLSVLILVLYKPMISSVAEHKDEMLTAMGFPAGFGFGKIFFFILILYVVSAVSNVTMIYVSVAVGQLFANHRVLGAIVAYFCINTVISIISGVIGAAYSISAITGAADESYIFSFYCRLFAFAMTLSLLMVVVSYIVTQLLMQKKLNLN